jgi:hypothetical protein
MEAGATFRDVLALNQGELRPFCQLTNKELVEEWEELEANKDGEDEE